MKKIILIISLYIFTLSSVQAGLFEYYQNGTLDAKIKYDSNPGIIQQLAPKKSTNTNYKNQTKITTMYPKIDRYTQYNRYFTSNGYYRQSDFQSMLQDERRNHKVEIDYLMNRETQIVQELNNIRRETSQYYTTLRYDLTRERDYNTQRKIDLTRMIANIEQELRTYSNDYKNQSSEYYYNDYGQRVYYTTSKNTYDNIYYKTNYTNAYYYCYDGICYSYDASTDGNLSYPTYTSNNTYSTNYYDTNCNRNNSPYNNSCYNKNTSSQTSWVNPDLKEIRDGYIQVR